MSSTPDPASTPPPERVLTWPLALFLLAVAALIARGLWSREWSPDLPRAIELLADGDLDGAERTAMLARVVALARDSEDLRERWAGLLAAVALGDRDAFDAARARLPGAAPAVPDAAGREWLDLGDAMLGNVLAAFTAEAAADRGGANRRWHQVAAQARLSARPFPGELAAAGVERTK